MRLLRNFSLLTFMLVLASITGLCIALGNMPLLLVAGTLALTSWFITEGPRGRSLPRWVTNILVLAAAMNGVVEFSQVSGDRWGVLGRFSVWLIIIKLYERRTARDHAQLLVLSLVLMMAGCLQSTDIAFGVVLLAASALGLYVLLLYQLYSSHERAKLDRAAAVPVGYRLVPPVKPIISRHVGLQFRSLVIVVALAGVCLSAIVFVMLPRDVGVNIMSGLQPLPSQRRVGFSDSIHLVSGNRITTSTRPVMWLGIREEGSEAGRTDEPVYLRGTVLEHYHGSGIWRGDPRGPHNTIRVSTGAMAALHDSDVPGAAHVLEIEPLDEQDHLFSTWAPVSVETEPPCGLIFAPQQRILTKDDHHGPIVRYRIRAQRDGLHESGEPPAKEHTQLLDDGLATLAHSILDDARLPRSAPRGDRGGWDESAARAFTDYLQTPDFQYTLDLSDVVDRAPKRGDPVIRFLTSTKRGHCEYFASGLAVLCHNVGIRCRIVAGYLVQEFDEAEGRYLVRDRNAHAWVEVFVGERGWQRFDPSPPAAVRELTASTPGLVDRADWLWQQGVIGFDGLTQKRLAGAMDFGISERLMNAVHGVRRWAADQAFYFGPTGYVWITLVMLAAAIACVAVVQYVRRARAIRRSARLHHFSGLEYHRLLFRLGFYIDMLRLLRRSGYDKPPWLPPLAFARIVAERRPEAAATVCELTDMFYAARYGRKRLQRSELARARALVERLGRQLRDGA
jgi:hypothetical protein